LNDLIVQSNNKNTFRTNHNGISSKLMVTQWREGGGNPIYEHPRGSNTHILTKNDLKYRYYANKFPIGMI
jgi:hypothetical protein